MQLPGQPSDLESQRRASTAGQQVPETNQPQAAAQRLEGRSHAQSGSRPSSRGGSQGVSGLPELPAAIWSFVPLEWAASIDVGWAPEDLLEEGEEIL